MPADALWTLCMTINVYLTFYHNYEPRQLKALEWRYVLACYGIPFIPALVFCFIRNAQQGQFYGPVVVWLQNTLLENEFTDDYRSGVGSPTPGAYGD